MKKIPEYLYENFQFLVVKFSIYLNRRIFVMYTKKYREESWGTLATCKNCWWYSFTFCEESCAILVSSYQHLTSTSVFILYIINENIIDDWNQRQPSLLNNRSHHQRTHSMHYSLGPRQTKHYGNTPIQIYLKFHHQKLKIFREKFWYFSYFCSKHRLWVLVRTASARRF